MTSLSKRYKILFGFTKRANPCPYCPKSGGIGLVMLVATIGVSGMIDRLGWMTAPLSIILFGTGLVSACMFMLNILSK